jgi:hypothetical protein
MQICIVLKENLKIRMHGQGKNYHTNAVFQSINDSVFHSFSYLVHLPVKDIAIAGPCPVHMEIPVGIGDHGKARNNSPSLAV